MTSPMQHRKTGWLKHKWKVFRFNAKAQKAKRKRNREIDRLARR